MYQTVCVYATCDIFGKEGMIFTNYRGHMAKLLAR